MTETIFGQEVEQPTAAEWGRLFEALGAYEMLWRERNDALRTKVWLLQKAAEKREGSDDT